MIVAPPASSPQPTCPFSKEDQLETSLDDRDDDSTAKNTEDSRHLPGYPRLQLSHETTLKDFIKGDIFSSDLESLAPKLWLISTHRHTNISPLHHQLVKGRSIVVAEDPSLHLVWNHDKIFIKPLPRYLLSHTFWSSYLLPPASPFDESERRQIVSTALGFLRSYFHLVRYESDFDIAIRSRLIPRGVSYPNFCAFSSRFDTITDPDVSTRYTYGEIRLTRLNGLSKLRRGKSYFHRVVQYDEYFARFYGPILFVFAIFSTVLNAMQVEMTVEQVAGNQWMWFWDLSRWFSVITLLAAVLSCIFLGGLLSWMLLDEWVYALTHRLRKREKNKIDGKEV
jgi:hypothetical protein